MWFGAALIPLWEAWLHNWHEEALRAHAEQSAAPAGIATQADRPPHAHDEQSAALAGVATQAERPPREPGRNQSWRELFLQPDDAAAAASTASSVRDGHSIVYLREFISTDERALLMAAAMQARHEAGTTFQKPHKDLPHARCAARQPWYKHNVATTGVTIDSDRWKADSCPDDSIPDDSIPYYVDPSNPMWRLSIVQRLELEAQALSDKLHQRLLSLLEKDFPSLAEAVFGRSTRLGEMYVRWYQTDTLYIGPEPCINIYEVSLSLHLGVARGLLMPGAVTHALICFEDHLSHT